MIKRYNIHIGYVVAFFALLTIGLRAQEQLMPLHANNVLTTLPADIKPASRTSSITASLSLPFFDDFSYSTKSPKPTPNLWVDSGGVFVNHTFPIAPISIGVATFDGLNKNGYPYNISALVANSAPADKLISLPINLKNKPNGFPYSPEDSLYLSFYCQAKGRGDAPEPNDSISVDVYKPRQHKWANIWGLAGYNPGATDTAFHRIMLPIKDTACFDSLFQFRFRNNATLSGSLDHWNIDYVYLNAHRDYEDTLKYDIAFEYMSTSFLRYYSAMPYKHYNDSMMAYTLHNYLRNNDHSNHQISYSDTIYDPANVKIGGYGCTNYNLYTYASSGTGTDYHYASPAISATFPVMTQPTTYTIQHVLANFTSTNTTDAVPANDTLIQKQVFSNYYAYDDGTAEGGYYNNTYGAKMAVAYTIRAKDTLGGMQIYFDPITAGLTIMGSSFRLVVWDVGNGFAPTTGTPLYRDSLSYPMYLQGNYNLMPIYRLTTCLPLDSGKTYYFGIQQTTNQPLNIGFDKNTDHSDKLFYDVGSGWTQSTIKGSIMINPIMGCNIPLGIDNLKKQDYTVNLFPNPAQNSFRIETNGLTLENASVTILSSIGQTVYTSTFNTNEPIDISNLPNGIYFVQLQSSTVTVTPKKLIITR